MILLVGIIAIAVGYDSPNKNWAWVGVVITVIGFIVEAYIDDGDGE